MPRSLITILPDSGDELVQLVNHHDSFIYAGDEFFQVFVLKFCALGIFPIAFSLLPLSPQLFGNRSQSGAVGVHAATFFSPGSAGCAAVCSGVGAGIDEEGRGPLSEYAASVLMVSVR